LPEANGNRTLESQNPKNSWKERILYKTCKTLQLGYNKWYNNI
jgi:hypothetical protein